MKLLIYSDLHLEFGPFEPASANADVVVLAGDIAVGVDGISWARRQFRQARVVYVLGNHEFYGGDVRDVLRACRREAKRQRVDLLECDEIVIDDVRFLGATLWTDFAVDVVRQRSVDDALRVANRGMSDFGLIRRGDAMLTAQDTRDMHWRAREWLREQLAAPHAGKTVVVTHHLPHVNSIHAQYFDHPLNPAFVSHLPELVRAPVDLWIHGHTHCSCDYNVAGTRVLCNPRGYVPNDVNAQFDAGLQVEL